MITIGDRLRNRVKNNYTSLVYFEILWHIWSILKFYDSIKRIKKNRLILNRYKKALKRYKNYPIGDLCFLYSS